MIGFGDFKLLNPVAYRNVRNPYNTLNFSVTQALKVQLQRLGDIVTVNLFPQFINGKVVIALFAQKPLPVFDDTTFYYRITLAFGTRYNLHIYKFCINILI